ncbi:uncharacterized protein A4U43_C03F10350 [Asparagus officinalis]|uniref:Longin domain-containing protein n=1 Tax=Asparagus officinalis TaxID=4686 RepID=A0A5P1F8V0_ASPOF|nr:uncharacterized protein A4U43_C03F10350 [Asparagus officinalis]
MVILADYTEFTGNFISIASQCLHKLPSKDNKFTYNCDGHTFNYLVEDGYAYCIVAVESVGTQLPVAFLERVRDDFNRRYSEGKATNAAANSLDREFGPRLKEHMQYCMDHCEEISKLEKVKAQVSQVQGVMRENIEKVLDRKDKIDPLVDKTDKLRSQIVGFLEENMIHATQHTLQSRRIVAGQERMVGLLSKRLTFSFVIPCPERKNACIKTVCSPERTMAFLRYSSDFGSCFDRSHLASKRNALHNLVFNPKLRIISYPN